MIGYIITAEQGYSIFNAINQAFANRGLQTSWNIANTPINSGEYIGYNFIPASDEILDTEIWKNLKVKDFPEFSNLIISLGGLDARIDIDPLCILTPIIEDLIFEESTEESV
jgi:hypothetical protein